MICIACDAELDEPDVRYTESGLGPLCEACRDDTREAEGAGYFDFMGGDPELGSHE